MNSDRPRALGSCHVIHLSIAALDLDLWCSCKKWTFRVTELIYTVQFQKQRNEKERMV